MIPIEYLKECFELDAENGKLFWKERPREHFKSDHSWKAANTRYAGREAFQTMDGKGYLRGRIGYNGTVIGLPAHWVIFALFYGRFPSKVLDHIDGIRTNNAITNLREASISQNAHNTRSHRDSAVPLKGVSRRRGKYRATIYVGRRHVHLGDFSSAEAAAAAYTAAAQTHFGEFARTN